MLDDNSTCSEWKKGTGTILTFYYLPSRRAWAYPVTVTRTLSVRRDGRKQRRTIPQMHHLQPGKEILIYCRLHTLAGHETLM